MEDKDVLLGIKSPPLSQAIIASHYAPPPSFSSYLIISECQIENQQVGWKEITMAREKIIN